MELNIPSCWLSSPRIHSSPSSSFIQTSSFKLKLQPNGIFQQTARRGFGTKSASAAAFLPYHRGKDYPVESVARSFLSRGRWTPYPCLNRAIQRVLPVVIS